MKSMFKYLPKGNFLIVILVWQLRFIEEHIFFQGTQLFNQYFQLKNESKN